MRESDGLARRLARSVEDRRGWFLLAASASVVVLHLVLSRNVPGPSVTPDEAGYLGNARWIAGVDPVYGMPVSPYYGFGYSLVLAPLHLVIDSPRVLWQSVLVVNAVLLAALVPLLFRLLRLVLEVPPRIALAAAAVGALVPAAVAVGPSALSENLSLPLVVVLGLATHAAVSDSPQWQQLWVGPTAALLYATHGRFTPVLLIVAVLLVVGYLRRWVSPWIAATNLGALIVLTLATIRAKRVLIEGRWSQVALEKGLGDGIDLLRSVGGVRRSVEGAVGQAWTQVIGSAGLAVVGLIGMTCVALGRTGTDANPVDASRVRPRRVTAGVLLLSGLGVFVASVLFFAGTRFRAHHLVYGRHNDVFVPVWVASATALLLHRRARRLARKASIVAWTSVAVLSLAVVELLDPLSEGGTYAPFAVPSLSRYLGDPASGTFVRASLGGLAGITLIVLVTVALDRPALLLVPLVAASVWVGMGRIKDVEGFSGVVYGDWDLPAQVAELGVDRASLNADETRGLNALMYQFWMPDVAFDLYEPKLDETPTEPFVFSSVADVRLAEQGYRIVLLDAGPAFTLRGTPEGMALWVRPGTQQDQFAERGLLLPVGFPTELPRTARKGDVRILDGVAGTTRTVAPGGRLVVPVEGWHLGTGAPWPDFASYPIEGRVRIVARVEPLDPDGVSGLPTGGELPSWIRQGQGFRTEATVIAIQPYFLPLPEGLYRVTLGIEQAGMDWFISGGEDATFTLRVRK